MNNYLMPGNMNQPMMYYNYDSMYNPQIQYTQSSMQQNIPNQRFGLGGKIVDSFDVFKATDIPMDGLSYYFPKADNTEIYTKRWLQNGTTETAIYKRVNDSQQIEENNYDNKLVERLNSIDSRMEKIEKLIVSNKQPNKSNTKKGEDVNE